MLDFLMFTEKKLKPKFIIFIYFFFKVEYNNNLCKNMEINSSKILLSINN